MRLLGIGIAIIAVMLLAAQAAENQPQVIRGQISQINWAGSTISVRWLQTEGYVSYDEVNLFVPNNTKIIKGTDSIGFTALNVGDQVTVEYINTSPGPLKALDITVVK